MGEHLSALALDTLAADLPSDLPTSGHLASCAACRAKLDALKTERAAFMQRPEFNARLAAIGKPGATAPRMNGALGALLAIAAAAVFVFFLFQRTEDVILKGSPTVELLDASGAPVTRAHVGDRLTLAVGGARKNSVAVFAVDDAGKVATLVAQTPLAAGARVPIGSAFEVTSGSMVVYACFGSAVPETAIATSPDCAKTKLEVLP